MSICEINESVCNENSDVSDFENKPCQPNNINTQQDVEVNKGTLITSSGYQQRNDAIIKVPSLLSGREKRNLSPPSCILHDGYVDPQSPSSSSSTSQTTSANDATFEPTIEMMVNDFDDEQTLNEEEALASLESQDPDEEIDTLKKESEMPLEELLAKYSALPPLPSSIHPQEHPRKRIKKSLPHKEKHTRKNKQSVHLEHTSNKSNTSSISNKVTDCSKHVKTNLEAVNASNSNQNILDTNEKIYDVNEKCTSSSLAIRKPFTSSVSKEKKGFADNQILHSEFAKVRRSHLLDLYPEGTFKNVVANEAECNSQETLFGVQEDEEDEEIEEEEDEDYKKKVMIGTSYQAAIPVGLSQYGDILPYENEDKLIWEPCQVSEREVEEYLIKIRDIKSNQQGNEDEKLVTEPNSENQQKENGRCENKTDNLENNSLLANGDTLLVESATIMETDNQTVVKDNEQALHLLVQCGYDFKEALRRKRLNALPLNDCMSLWSEEECHKFEEGIQKYGKDFLKIRQNQVRTRTMRELVQFYYLWKKSERRDNNFANADTVDHMDIYLNEDNEYGSNPASVLTPVGSPDGNISNFTGSARNSNFSQKSISIMTTTSTMQASTNLSEKTGSNSCLQQHHKRRSHNSNQLTNIAMAASEFNSESCSNTLSSTSK